MHESEMQEELEKQAVETGKHALTVDEVEQVLAVEDRLDRRALLATAIGTGIRREDVVALQVANLEVVGDERKAIRVSFYEEKKDRPWVAWLPADLAQPLRTWIRTRDSESKYVWPSERSSSGHVSGRTAFNWLQEALDQAGLDRRPFHALRSTCIKLLKRAGWSEEQIQDQTGDNLRTIRRHYLTPTKSEMRNRAIEGGVIS